MNDLPIGVTFREVTKVWYLEFMLRHFSPHIAFASQAINQVLDKLGVRLIQVLLEVVLSF